MCLFIKKEGKLLIFYGYETKAEWLYLEQR